MTNGEQEPGGWELQRSISQLAQTVREGNAGLNQRLDQLVTRDSFQAEQRRVEGVLKAMADDIHEEREARAAAVSALERQLERLTTTLRWVAASIVIPIALFLANLYVSRGGA